MESEQLEHSSSRVLAQSFTQMQPLARVTCCSVLSAITCLQGRLQKLIPWGIQKKQNWAAEKYLGEYYPLICNKHKLQTPGSISLIRLIWTSLDFLWDNSPAFPNKDLQFYRRWWASRSGDRDVLCRSNCCFHEGHSVPQICPFVLQAGLKVWSFLLWH